MNNQRVQVRVIRKFKEGWLCAEAVNLAVLDQLKIDAKPQMIKAVSAFSYGMGGTGKEHCGAFTGGIATLGVLFGREEKGLDLNTLHDEVKAFRQWFQQTHGSLNCNELVESFGELRDSECVGLTAAAAEYLVSRSESAISKNAELSGKKKSILPGQCPFTEGD